MKTFISICSVLLFASVALGGDSKSDNDIAKKKALTMGARAAAGAAIGGQVGKVIGGSSAGAAAGITLTPSRIGCDSRYETCARK